MGRYYGIKIKNGIMIIEEVPKLWQVVTRKWLEANS